MEQRLPMSPLNEMTPTSVFCSHRLPNSPTFLAPLPVQSALSVLWFTCAHGPCICVPWAFTGKPCAILEAGNVNTNRTVSVLRACAVNGHRAGLRPGAGPLPSTMCLQDSRARPPAAREGPVDALTVDPVPAAIPGTERALHKTWATG